MIIAPSSTVVGIEKRLFNRRNIEIVIFSLVVLLSGDALLRTGFASGLWLLVYIAVVSLILIHLREFLDVFKCNQSVLFIGYLACISTIWSIMPMVTLTASLQLTFTIIIGIYLGSRFKLLEILLIYAMSAGATILISSINLTGLFGDNYSYVGGFLGIYTHKNLFAQQIGLFILCSLPFAYMYKRSRPYIFIAIIFALYFLYITKSVATLGAVMLFFSATIIVFMLVATQISRFSINLLCIICGTLVFLMFLYLNINFWDIMATLGKDRTLTGRLDIWQLGLQHFKQNEYIGVGYAAFWKSPQYASEINLLKDYYGENVTAFHNFGIEAIVSFGILGIFPIAVFCFTPSFRLYKLLMMKTRASHWCVIFTVLMIIGFCLFLALFGPLLMRQHETTIFLFPALAVAAQLECMHQKWKGETC